MAELAFWVVAVLALAVSGTSLGIWFHNWMTFKRAERHRHG